MSSAATIATACTALVDAVTTGGAGLEGAPPNAVNAARPSLAIIAARDGAILGLCRAAVAAPQAPRTSASLRHGSVGLDLALSGSATRHRGSGCA